MICVIDVALEDASMKAVEWETSRIHELDLASTELSTDCLMDMLCRMPGFTFLGLAYCEFFTDKVSSLYGIIRYRVGHKTELVFLKFVTPVYE